MSSTIALSRPESGPDCGQQADTDTDNKAESISGLLTDSIDEICHLHELNRFLLAECSRLKEELAASQAKNEEISLNLHDKIAAALQPLKEQLHVLNVRINAAIYKQDAMERLKEIKAQDEKKASRNDRQGQDEQTEKEGEVSNEVSNNSK